ncbi:MAG: DNA gyrase inhibitor YacG [Beijerinckiaceae bacterium]|nr:DNA gyrase inhibitor YacG [Beijerinckiaceae bacterium]MCI0737310.1 DNA gyrase inhibitor YacG [Beijerinckiaceae bacterium]
MPATKHESGIDQRHAGGRAHPCPICGKPDAFATRPFCSNRCADIDLYRWLGGVYTIPAIDEPDAGSSGSGKEQRADIPAT